MLHEYIQKKTCKHAQEKEQICEIYIDEHIKALD